MPLQDFAKVCQSFRTLDLFRYTCRDVAKCEGLKFMQNLFSELTFNGLFIIAIKNSGAVLVG